MLRKHLWERGLPRVITGFMSIWWRIWVGIVIVLVTQTVSHAAGEDSIIGTWTYQDTEGKLIGWTFLTGGEFIYGLIDKTDELGQSGMEYGTYVWNTALHSLMVTVTDDTNGKKGLVQASGNTAYFVADKSVDSKMLMVISEESGEELNLTILENIPQALSGSWIGNCKTDSAHWQCGNIIVISYLSSDYYLSVTRNTDDEKDGVEWGTYTWNSNNGALIVMPNVDTDGDNGLSGFHSETVWTISGNQLTAHNPEISGLMRLQRPDAIGANSEVDNSAVIILINSILLEDD